MDHDVAVKSEAVERYLLGTMSDEERDAFEEHYFSCPECADEIRTAARFRANAREAFRDPSAFPVKSRFHWLRSPILAPFALACALLLTYQNAVQIPSLKQQARVRSFASFALHTVQRSAEQQTRIPAGVSQFALYFDVPGGSGAPRSYECTIRDEAGKTIDSFQAPAPSSGEPLNILFHRSSLAPGRYILNVQGAGVTAGSASENLQFTFTLE